MDTLWNALLELDDLTASTNSIMTLLSSLLIYPQVRQCRLDLKGFIFFAVNTTFLTVINGKLKPCFSCLSQHASVSDSVGSSSVAVPETYHCFCSPGRPRNPLHTAFQSRPGWIFCAKPSTHTNIKVDVYLTRVAQ